MLNYQYNLKELLTILEDQGETDSFIRDIFRFNLLRDEHFGIEEILFDFHIDSESKLKFLEETVLTHVGEFFYSFLVNITKNDDIIFYPMITKKILDLLEKEKGCDFVQVISETPLNKETLSKIQDALEEVTKRSLYIYNSTSKDVLGGFIIKIEDKTIDLSLKSDLEHLKLFLLHHV
jgi:F-type H+-transporting ATPase subunit delta